MQILLVLTIKVRVMRAIEREGNSEWILSNSIFDERLDFRQLKG